MNFLKISSKSWANIIFVVIYDSDKCGLCNVRSQNNKKKFELKDFWKVVSRSVRFHYALWIISYLISSCNCNKNIACGGKHHHYLTRYEYKTRLNTFRPLNRELKGHTDKEVPNFSHFVLHWARIWGKSVASNLYENSCFWDFTLLRIFKKSCF